MIGTPLTSRNFSPLSDAVVHGDDLYFIYRPDVDSELLNPTTLTAQIWKADISANQLTAVANFYGPDSYYNRPSQLVSAGDKIVFSSWNPAKESVALWSFNPATGTKSVIPAHEGNGYRDPNLATYAGGALYFVGASENVPDLYGNVTSQIFIVGPAPPGSGLPGDFNHDGSVDAGDYVTLRKQGGTPEDYTLWRQNFGRTIAAGAGLNSESLANRESQTILARASGNSEQVADDSSAIPTGEGTYLVSNFGTATPNPPRVDFGAVAAVTDVAHRAQSEAFSHLAKPSMKVPPLVVATRHLRSTLPVFSVDQLPEELLLIRVLQASDRAVELGARTQSTSEEDGENDVFDLAFADLCDASVANRWNVL
jgi:hypothetical protein